MNNLSKKEAAERISKLRSEINRHRYLYHVLDKQEISEAALDSLKHELALLEEQFPDLITPDSPTQRVAGKALDEFKKVTHVTPMLSLSDAFSPDEMYEWEARIKKLAPAQKEWDYYAELKMDGLAISLVYQNGLFVQAATRGDGKIGEDVTHNIKTIESVPLRLEVRKGENDALVSTASRALRGRFEVRGEVYFPLAAFLQMNKEQEKKGEEAFANPRNAAAGTIRQLDPRIAAGRGLEFLAYDIPTNLGQKTHEEIHQIAALLGFKTNPKNQHCRNIEEVIAYHESIGQIRQKLGFQIDGIVVVVNSLKLLESLGIVGKAPRGMMAYKFPAEQATTVVEDIVVQVGRTGALTPVAHLKPVVVAGSTVSRATLHNEDEIARKDIRIGDTVIVQKAGDVIPEIVEPLLRMRTGKEKKFVMPKICPVCSSSVSRVEGEAVLRCANPNCFAQNRRKLFHFVSKSAMDMEGLGPKIIEQLINEGLVAEPADFFQLKTGDLESLERFAEKKAQNVVDSIQGRKKTTLGRFLFGLGIRHIGEQLAQELADILLEDTKNLREAIKKARNMTKEDWENHEGVGEIVAESLTGFFHGKRSQALIDHLLDAGVEIEKQAPRTKGKLFGKTFVITGTLSMERNEAKEKIRNLGGKTGETVSAKTDFVVVGENPGSKAEKAKKLDLKILDEKEFLKMIS